MSLCNCGNEKNEKRQYCKECYKISTKNLTLRTKTKNNQPKFDLLSIYIKNIETKGGFELSDINGIIEMYEVFYGSEFCLRDRGIGYMWNKLKKLNKV